MNKNDLPCFPGVFFVILRGLRPFWRVFSELALVVVSQYVSFTFFIISSHLTFGPPVVLHIYFFLHWTDHDLLYWSLSVYFTRRTTQEEHPVIQHITERLQDSFHVQIITSAWHSLQWSAAVYLWALWASFALFRYKKKILCRSVFMPEIYLSGTWTLLLNL